jgi:hypothetical protein
MEDGFGNFIYIILMILALVIGLIGKKRKQKGETPLETGRRTSDSDMFRKFVFGEEETPDVDKQGMSQVIEEEPVIKEEIEKSYQEGVSDLNEVTLQTETEEKHLVESKQTEQQEENILERMRTINAINRLESEMLTDDIKLKTAEELAKPYELKIEESELGILMDEFDLEKAVILSEII